MDAIVNARAEPGACLRPARPIVRIAHALVTGALAVLLASCSLFEPRFEAPRLSLVNVELLKSDLFEQQLKVRLRVQNPNSRTLPVKGVACTIDLQGREFASGVSGASFVVPANGEAEFDMKVTANMAGALFALFGRSGVAQGGGVGYRLRGKVSLSEGILRNIPFEQTGTFRLQ